MKANQAAEWGESGPGPWPTSPGKRLQTGHRNAKTDEINSNEHESPRPQPSVVHGDLCRPGKPAEIGADAIERVHDEVYAADAAAWVVTCAQDLRTLDSKNRWTFASGGWHGSRADSGAIEEQITQELALALSPTSPTGSTLPSSFLVSKASYFDDHARGTELELKF